MPKKTPAASVTPRWHTGIPDIAYRDGKGNTRDAKILAAGSSSGGPRPADESTGSDRPAGPGGASPAGAAPGSPVPGRPQPGARPAQPQPLQPQAAQAVQSPAQSQAAARPEPAVARPGAAEKLRAQPRPSAVMDPDEQTAGMRILPGGDNN